MFTDIAGFTSLAETLSPTAVADLLTQHFISLAACIERERGQIDRVAGDSLLAFWDSTLPHQASAAPAVRAALRIRAAVAESNAARTAAGLPPIHVRIGLHAGPLMVTRLSAASRLGVTLCGDTLNVAQRLEEAARHVPGERGVAILASEAVVARAGGGFSFDRLGAVPLRGRSGPVRAFAVQDHAR